MSKIIVLDPTYESSIEQPANSTMENHKLSSLDNQVLAIINNGKRHADVFLKHVLNIVKERFRLKDIIWIDKINASLPIKEEVVQQLNTAQAVIAGVGD